MIQLRAFHWVFLYNLHRKTLEAKTKNSGQALDNSLARPGCKMIFG